MPQRRGEDRHEPVGPQRLADDDQAARQQRQVRAARGEDPHDVGHDIGHQHGDDPERHHGEQRGVEQRELDRLGIARAVLDEGRQMPHHLVELARLFAGDDRRAVVLREDARILRQRLAEAAAIEHRGAHVEQHRRDARRALLGDRAQRVLDPHAAADQRGELAGDQRQVARPDAWRNRPKTASFRYGAPAVPPAGSDLDRQKSARAQILPRRHRARRLEHAGLRPCRCGPQRDR